MNERLANKLVDWFRPTHRQDWEYRVMLMEMLALIREELIQIHRLLALREGKGQ